MNTELIKLFNAALPEKSSTSFAAVNAEAIQRGYIVEPAACTDSVFNFLREITINPNATFYKTWDDILSKTRFELFIDQMFHYMTTYGTDFTMGNGYVPNDGDINIQTTFSTFKVIKAITPEELFNRCYDMLKSGIALKQSTMETVADYMIQYVEDIKNKNLINIDEIKNREAVTYLCTMLDIFPNDAFSLFRLIMYLTTDKTMIIKNRAMINTIKGSAHAFDFSKLTELQMRNLASIFLRYKDLFLAFKHTSKANAIYINKLRRLANTYHKPMKDSFWNTVFTKEYTAEKLISELPNLTPYKKVALMQTCIERSYNKENQIYIIRNQKAYVRCGHKAAQTSEEYRQMVYSLLRMSLVEDIKKHAMKEVKHIDENGEVITEQIAKTVKVGRDMTVALPTSEKSFLGNYPFGTTFDMTHTDSIIGIYWRNEWGTRDFDLSFISINGEKIGWNSAYYNRNTNIVYSGDMTNAEPEAAENLYMASGCPTGIVKVNQYSGSIPSKFRLYFANETVTKYSRGYMVNPANIKLQVEVPVDQRETLCALVNGKKAVLMDIRTGNIPVSGYNRYTPDAIKSLFIKSECFIDADSILKDAGFNIVDVDYTGDVDIDFTNLDKDSLISIMA